MVGGDYHGVVTLFLSHPHAMLGWHNCPFRPPPLRNVACRMVVQVVDLVLCVVAFVCPNSCCVQSVVSCHVLYSVIVTLVSVVFLILVHVL